jgi:two-component system response regulator YesN
MRKVLIVDDEIMVRVGMKAILDWEACGWTVVGECANGREALEKIAVSQPDLVLTDLKMDVMDGVALMETCRVQYPNIRFIILSNYNDFENTQKAIRLGAIDYIFKLTVTTDELRETLKRAEAHFASEAKSEQMLRRNITAIRTGLIKAAVEGSYPDEAALLQDLSEVCPHNDFAKPYCEMQLSIDSDQGGFQPGTVNELQQFKSGLENLLTEVLDPDGIAEIYNFSREDFIIIFNTESIGDQDAVHAYAAKKFELILEYVKRYFSISITGALSGIYSGIGQLSKAVGETEQILTYRTENECGVLHVGDDTQRPEILTVKQYVHEHLHEEISLEEAAHAVNMSQSYFSHIFKDEMKISFTAYVNRMRIQKACQLLKNPRLKINEIALAVGIENFNYFSVLFKKTTGLSPNTYREQL